MGTYVLEGFIWCPNDPNGNFGFNEDADYVEAITEDYYYGDHLVFEVDSLPYKYKPNYSFTWHIVASEG